MSSRIIVGISGASCTGKTTLVKLLRATFPWACTVHQDAYYYPNDPKYHVYLSDVKHFNYDLPSAINFPKLEGDLQKVLSSQLQFGEDKQRSLDIDEKALCCPNDSFVMRHQPPDTETNYLMKRFSKISLLLLEGKILFTHPTIYNLCNLKYFLTLDKNELLTRRQQRVYEPPNPPGYVEKYVWPAYVSRMEETKLLPGIHYYDAKTVPLLNIYQEIKRGITMTMASMITPEPPFEYSDAKRVGVKKG